MLNRENISISWQGIKQCLKRIPLIVQSSTGFSGILYEDLAYKLNP